MGIVRFALRFPYTFYVLAAFIVFLGVSAIVVMPEDIFPEINIPVVSVIWQYTGLSTPEMEQRVSTYSQYSISTNVTGIKNMEAQTLNGISVLKIYFQPDVNLDLAIAQIVSISDLVRSVLPPGIQPPIVVQYNASSVPVLQLSLASDRYSEQELYDYGLYNLRQQLAPVPGRLLPPRVFDKNAAHGLGGRREEMRAAVPARGGRSLIRIRRARRVLHQPQIGFVNQGGGLEGVAGGLASHLGAGQLAELLVDDGKELLRRGAFKDGKRLHHEVLDKICRKIGWTTPVPASDTEQFLRDFYSAERAYLEREQLYGRPKASKDDTGKPPAAA